MKANNKLRKFIVVFMISLLCIYPLTSFAEDLGTKEENPIVTKEQSIAANQLLLLGLFSGYEDGSLRLENPIIRGEMATLMVRLMDKEHDVLETDVSFSDVPESYWAYQRIRNAVALGLVSGYPDHTFKPKKNISYVEVVALMVRTLKQDNNLEGNWPMNYINKGYEIGIISSTEVEPNKAITRGQVAEMLWKTIIYKD